jgi:hypothetical protein
VAVAGTPDLSITAPVVFPVVVVTAVVTPEPIVNAPEAPEVEPPAPVVTVITSPASVAAFCPLATLVAPTVRVAPALAGIKTTTRVKAIKTKPKPLNIFFITYKMEY